MNEIKLDSFFTHTRMRMCLAVKCRFNIQANCHLKEIAIGDGGLCRYFEPKQKLQLDSEPILAAE